MSFRELPGRMECYYVDMLVTSVVSWNTTRNKCHFLNSLVDRLVQFTQLEHNFNLIVAVLKSMGGT